MDQILDQKIRRFLEENRMNMVKDLQSLVRIASYKEAPAPGAPFGPGPAACMRSMLALCADHGFIVRDVDGYCGYAQWGESDEHVATLSHLDTVPIGDGWIHDPLGGAFEDGVIYGRGVADNKAGAIASLYALLALKSAGFIPKRAIRMIFGCDEESGMADMPYYLAREKAPEYAFSPDAGFPLFYAEKGRIDGRVTAKFTAPTALVRVEGGVAANVVPAQAKAWLTGCRAAQLPRAEYIEVRDEDGMTVIEAAGVSCHGGSPQGGRNAASLLLDYLARALPEEDGAHNALGAYARLIGMGLDGAGMGLDCRDEVSGEMTLNVGMIGGDKNGLWFHFDIRHPVTLDARETAAKLGEILGRSGWTLAEPHVSDPLYVPLDHPLITTLMEVYREVTGDPTPPATMGGGTYARTLPCAVSYGHAFPGDNSRAHTYEENLHIEQLIKATRIYAHALARLSYLEDENE
jgi:succinyl-diaminopimelate desuccinylase